jgi:integrase
MGRVYKPRPRVERGRAVNYANWYVEWQSAGGKTRRRAVGPDRRLAVQALARFEDEARRARLGLPAAIDPATTLGRSLASLLPEYLAELASRDTSPEYRALVEDYLARTAADCRWFTLADVSAASLSLYLGRRRDEWGNGPATLNSYLRTAKGFCNWWARRFGLSSPLRELTPYPEEVDRRRSRRILTDDELEKLVASAAAAPRRYRASVPGPARAVLYRVAAFSGLRAGELAELTPAHFDLAGRPPTVTASARDSKGKREEPLPLPGHLAVLLAAWLADKPPGEKLWPGPWAANRHQCDWLAGDLRRAGVAERDERGRRVTFHSLKRRFVVRLIQAGAKIHEVRRMARHRDVKTTLDYYTDESMADLGKLADRLPAVG